ncbi:MAG: nickel pincer cofactor biosynthesis protein LarC [Acidimicrobiales bacterium]
MTARRHLAWFHCFSGIAGDMALAALIDAGADPDEVRALLDRLPIGGWELTVEAVMRGGIAGTNAHVVAEETTVHRTAAHISALIEEARLPARLTQRALSVFDSLAMVEGRLHGRPPSQVHFHEVGAVDSIVDIVGTCAALEVLDVDEVAFSPIATGLGMVRSAHGAIPNPAPATVELLAGVPSYGIDSSVELTTPTGASLVRALGVEFGPLPAMRIEASGFGAGDAQVDDRPNLLQVVLGARDAHLGPGQAVTMLEANVDDLTGEHLAHAVAALLDGGAHDAWVTPILMKKGRPAYTVSALCDPALAGQVARMMREETGSFGVRGRELERWPAERRIDEVEVEGRSVRVKVSAGRVKVEHEDAVRAARHIGIPVRDVVSLAEEAYRRRGDSSPHPVMDDSPVDPTDEPA